MEERIREKLEAIKELRGRLERDIYAANTVIQLLEEILTPEIQESESEEVERDV